MNKAILVGRLTKDPEIKYTQDNRAFLRLTLAIDRGKNKEGKDLGADFINCFAWENKAETIAKYVKKGHKFGVAGRIRTSTYDKQDGSKGYLTEVSIDEMEFLESKPKEELPEPYHNTPTQTEQTPTQEEDPFKEFGEQVEINDEDLPFN